MGSIPAPGTRSIFPRRRWITLDAGPGVILRQAGLLVKCRQGIIAFGAGLPDDELRHLSRLVECALRGPKR